MAISSIEEIPTPRGVTRLQVEATDSPTEINSALNNLYDFSREVANYMEEQYQILHNGALVRSWQVEELLAGSIGAGTISVDQIYLGSDKFELDGALGQIRIKDDAGIVMVEMGEFGAGSDWGIKVRDGSNNVKFSALSNAGVTMDGGIIANATLNGAALIDATITGAKILGGTITGAKIDSATITNSNISDVNGNKIDSNSIANSKLISISADKITLSGTLECTSGGTAIDITDSGLIHFSGGGDIVMDMAGTNQNFIVFRNASSTEKGYIFLNTSDHFKFLGASGVDVHMQAQGAGEVRLYAGSSGAVVVGESNTTNLQIVARVDSDIIPDDDNSWNLGSGSLRWATLYSQTLNTGDIQYSNGWVDTEPDKVYSWADPQDGLLKMNEKWEPIYWFHKDGTIQTDNFKKPDIAKGQKQ